MTDRSAELIRRLDQVLDKLESISNSLSSISENLTITPRPFSLPETTLGDEISSSLERISRSVDANASGHQLAEVIKLLGKIQAESEIVSTDDKILSTLQEVKELLGQMVWK